MKLFALLNLIFVSIIAYGIEKKLNRTLFYEASSVELQGRLSVKTFPGPPNYESIKGGDKAESGYYLTLGEPIDVTSDLSKPSDYRDDNEKNLKLIQLIVLEDKLYSVIRKYIKSKEMVTIKGTLIHRLTGHHHTPVLINAAEITKIDSHKK